MKLYPVKNVNNGYLYGPHHFVERSLMIGGLALISLLLVYQYGITESVMLSGQFTLTELQMTVIDEIAVPVFVLYIIGTISMILGLVLIFYKWKKETHFSYSTNPFKRYYYMFKSSVIFIFSNPLSNKIFFITLISYFSLSLFLNNSIVYRTNNYALDTHDFAGAGIYVIGCCGSVGTFPVINIHMTQNLGFILIPINLIIPILYSLLISLTISMIVLSIHDKTLKNRFIKNKGTCGIVSLNAFSGFFISCPTCTGNMIITSLLGTGFLVSSSVVLSIYQYALAGLNFAVAIIILLYLMKKYISTNNIFMVDNYFNNFK